MKTSNYLIALAALSSLTLVGCSDNDFLGDGPGGTFGGSSSKGELSFAAGGGKTTRAEITGQDAADRLGGHFTVYGWKQVNEKSNTGHAEASLNAGFQDVFADYVVTWKGAASAGSTESNTRGWEYVGDTTAPVALTVGTALDPSEQYIHYWDWSTDRYDFTAWSIAKGNAQVVSRNKVTGYNAGAKASTAPEVTFFASTPKDLGGVYVSDKFTSTPDGKKPRFENAAADAVKEGATAGSTDVNALGIDSVFFANHPGQAYHIGKYSKVDDYTNTTVTDKGVVNLQFRNLAAKVRIGIYETIPGYKVSDVVFYEQDATNKYLYTWAEPANNDDFPGDQTYATLFAVDATTPANAQIFGRGGNVTVKYHDTYYNAEGLQRDNVAYTSTTFTNKKSYFAFGKLTNERGSTTAINYTSGEVIGTTSNTATMSIGNDDDNLYTYVFPMETNQKPLELKVNYKLTSLDGSGEVIRVTGANATVPVKFAQWKSNYAYTYLFKVSDNTNGYTDETGVEGLYPITFDACVVNTEDGQQETITTINNTSITTYQDGSQVLKDNEYKNGKNIYVTVEGLPTLSSSNFKLYIAEDFDAVEGITEETAANYLYNGIVFTDVTSKVYFGETAIPNTSGNKNPIKVTAGQAATFMPEDNTVYVVKYFTTGDDAVESYKVIKVGSADATQTYTVSVDASSSVATNEPLTFTIKKGDYVVTGAKSAIVIKKGTADVTSQFAIAETSTPGTYTATPKTAIATTGETADYQIGISDDVAANKFTVTAPVWFNGETQITNDNYVAKASITAGDATKNSMVVKLYNKAASGALITDVKPTVEKSGVATKEVTIVEVLDAQGKGTGDYTITATDKASGTYTITQNGGTMKLNVDKYSLALDHSIINFGDTDHKVAKLTLTNAGATSTLSKAVTVSTGAEVTATATASESSASKSTITAAKAGKATLTVENASIDIEVVDYVLEQAKDRDGVVTVQLKQKKAGETTYSAAKNVTTLKATSCTITPTTTDGIYKVNGGAADTVVQFEYKGVVVADVTLVATKDADPGL